MNTTEETPTSSHLDTVLVHSTEQCLPNNYKGLHPRPEQQQKMGENVLVRVEFRQEINGTTWLTLHLHQ